MKFYIKTLGCKMNWIDSARLRTALQLAGHEEAANEPEADYLFVNSCTVTAEADRKSRQAASAAVGRTVPVAVMGCSPRANSTRWEERGGQRVFSDEAALYRHFDIDPETLPVPIGVRTRLPIAIQRGCDNRCGFCITRIARGSHSNVPVAEVVRQIEIAEEMGIQEVILTGINLAAWGCSDTNRPEQARLGELLSEILARTTIPRLRLSSLGPEYLNRGVIDTLGEERICDYFHLSVQSGSDGVLKRMERGHGTAEIARFAADARRLRPDLSLAADIIAGFPGETVSEHAETVAFLESQRFAKLHVFPFSPREGTPAATMKGQVDGGERKARARELRELGGRMRGKFLASQLGRTLPVLVERGGSGLTPNYLRIRCETEEVASIVSKPVSETTLVSD